MAGNGPSYYEVFVDEIRYELSLEEIFKLRNEPLVIVSYDSAGSELRQSYEEFSKLYPNRKVFLELELADTQSGRSTPTTSDTLTGEFKSPSKSIDSDCVQLHTMDLLSFLKLAGSLIPRFSDDANELEYFIDQVLQLETATPEKLKPNLITFVKGRLIGKARYSASDCNTIPEIISALRRDIVLESSEILESRLAALRFDDKNLTDFATAVEKLSDQIINSLMSEGVTKFKAIQMTTRMVVDNCRKSARSQTIKTILAASSFTSPRDVLTKFRIEVAELKKDSQVLGYNYNHRRGGHSNHHNNNYNDQYHQPSNIPINGSYNSGYQNPNHNNQRNNGYSSRGRGRGRGNYSANPNHRVFFAQASPENNQPPAENIESENEEAARWPTDSQ